MVQYLVTQKPKRKYREALYTMAAVIVANSAAQAVRIAETTMPNDFGKSDDYTKATAEPLTVGTVYRF